MCSRGEQRGVPNTETLTEELRRTILASCTSSCPEPAELVGYYHPQAMSPLPTRLAAHIVSCSACLDLVNRLLNISSLNHRDPSDTAGKQSDSLPFNKRSGRTARLALADRDAADVYEHRPLSLCVAVNGQPVVLQRLTDSSLEITVKLHQLTGIDFVEVFSEQDIRLLMIPILAPPPDGPFDQSAVTRLGQGQQLRAALSFTSPWPSLDIAYRTEMPAPEPIAEPVHDRWFEHVISPPKPRGSFWKWAGVVLVEHVALHSPTPQRHPTSSPC